MQRPWSILARDRQVKTKQTVYTWNTGVGLELELVLLGSWHMLEGESCIELLVAGGVTYSKLFPAISILYLANVNLL